MLRLLHLIGGEFGISPTLCKALLTTNPDYCCDCGDFDHNGTIELNDVRILAKNWLWTGTPGGYNIGDLNCDGKIYYEDFAIFVLQWLGSCP